MTVRVVANAPKHHRIMLEDGNLIRAKIRKKLNTLYDMLQPEDIPDTIVMPMHEVETLLMAMVVSQSLIKDYIILGDGTEEDQ